MSDIDLEAIQRLRSAWENPGRSPELHIRSMHRLKNEWPVLWNAIMGVLYGEADKPEVLIDAQFRSSVTNAIGWALYGHPDVAEMTVESTEMEVVDRVADRVVATIEALLVDYLDGAIRAWRSIDRQPDHELQSIAAYYIDAYQAVRMSMLGELLPVEEEV